MRASLIVSLFSGLLPTAGATEFTGYYPLTVAYGNYQRSDHFASNYDGLPQAESTTIDLDDSVVNNGVDEGYLVILSSGEVTGHWVQQLNFTASWNGVYLASSRYSGIFTPEVRLDVDVTGTVLAETATSVTLQLEALIDCDYSMPSGFTLGDLSRLGPSPVVWSATDIPLQITVTAQRSPDGGLTFDIPTTGDILPVLAAASPELEGVAMRNFAWPETSQPFLNSFSEESEIPGLAVSAGAEIDIGKWNFGPTAFQFAAPFTGLKPVFSEYYLLDVAAPFGFIASSTQADLPGEQSVHFHYGDQVSVQSLEEGRAFAPFDYGAAPEEITAEVLSNGVVVENLSRPLIKLPVPTWAAPASAWSAVPGVTYSRSLDWPVTLATTQTLSNASILTGLWGITGAAESDMKIAASSLGTPTAGTLEGAVNFHAAGKDIGFTLGGTHTATLNASGLSLTGSCETSPLAIPLLETNITPLSLVPGLQTAVSNVHPFFQRLIRGSGLGIRSELSMSAAGEYAAVDEDTSPRFTSGSIVGAVDVSARVNILPQMMRDILYFGIEGGGGLETEIQLAPNVEMTSLGGHLYFSAVASLFGLEAEAQHDYAFGDYTPPPAAALRAAGPPAAFASLETNAAVPIAECLPARANIGVSFAVDFTSTIPTLVVASVPDQDQPTTSSNITLRSVDRFGAWSLQEIVSPWPTNLAPTLGRGRLTGATSNRIEPVEAIVWSSNFVTQPTDPTASELEDFANGMELRFQEYSAALNEQLSSDYLLTTNSLCDFGATIPQVAGGENVRVFWARSVGTDFTGSTTPLTLHTRTWLKRNTDEPAIGWSPEVQAVGSLNHIVDWRAIVLSATESAIVITRDTDGDFATLDDTELWLARETAGVWAAPAQITANAVADEQPVMIYNGTELRMAWRQGGDVVYLPDVYTGLIPQVLLPASAVTGGGFARARLGSRTSQGGGGLFLAWPEGSRLAYTFEGMAAPAPGALLPPPRHVPAGRDTVSGFDAFLRNFGDADYLETVTMTTGATVGSPASIPLTTQARLAWSALSIGLFEPASAHVRLEDTQPSLTLAAGEELLLETQVEERAGASLQWLLNGNVIPGAVSPTYRKTSVTDADAGTYVLRVSDALGSKEYPVSSVIVSESFATWALAQSLTAPLDTRESDADSDGAPNDLEYLFGTDPLDSSSLPVTRYFPSTSFYDGFTFNVRAASTDCDFAIENTHDFISWNNLRDVQGVYGDNPYTVTSSYDGLRNYFVLVPNYESHGSIGTIDWTRGFMRVRMIRSPAAAADESSGP